MPQPDGLLEGLPGNWVKEAIEYAIANDFPDREVLAHYFFDREDTISHVKFDDVRGYAALASLMAHQEECVSLTAMLLYGITVSQHHNSFNKAQGFLKEVAESDNAQKASTAEAVLIHMTGRGKSKREDKTIPEKVSAWLKANSR